MKFLLLAAAVVAVAVAGPTRFITPGGAGPAPILVDSPVHAGPTFIDESVVGPVVVDDWDTSPISVGPALVEEESPISVGPALVEESAPVYSSPLVQVIVNVNKAPAAPAEIIPTPVIVVDNPEIEPTPVEVVDMPEVPEDIIVAPIEIPEIDPTPVEVVDEPEIPEPVIIAPIEVEPVITLPDELN